MFHRKVQMPKGDLLDFTPCHLGCNSHIVLLAASTATWLAVEAIKVPFHG